MPLSFQKQRTKQKVNPGNAKKGKKKTKKAIWLKVIQTSFKNSENFEKQNNPKTNSEKKNRELGGQKKTLEELKVVWEKLNPTLWLVRLQPGWLRSGDVRRPCRL